jgi:Spy/CpxP family protein refolding chaperone
VAKKSNEQKRETKENMKNEMTRRASEIGMISRAVIVVAGMLAAGAQAQPAPQQPAHSSSNAALTQQIAELQEKVKQLEAALASQSHATPGASLPGMSPAGGGMSMDRMKMGGMNKADGSMTGGEMTGMMGMMNQMMGMNAMPGASPGMSASMSQSALPGFPGVSHLYHIGSTGFFLDHAEHISLSTDQQAALDRIKDQALAAKSSGDLQIEHAEKEMATLTAADQPDSAKIEAKVREIEMLRANERIAFIRAVGDAAKLLTDDQRKILTGAMQTAPASSPMPSATMSPMSDM